MFEDILGHEYKECSQKDEILRYPKSCPYCGASDIGLGSVDGHTTYFFCAKCGYTWE